MDRPHDNSTPGNITDMLRRWNDGDESALEQLVPIVHKELRRIADSYLRREASGHTLQPTALVNEAYIRLLKSQGIQWQNREQFFGISANLMRQVLVDHARRSSAVKRGRRQSKVTFDDRLDVTREPDEELLLLDLALTKLSEFDPIAARIVELRYFAGLTVEETARLLKTSPRTVKRQWSSARLWLLREISRQ